MSTTSTAPAAPSAHPPKVHFPYHYVPTEWICALFVALFGLSALIHLIQAVRTRLWWLIPTACIAGVAEVIGWSARLWSSKNPYLLEPFLMQISTTIIAPTPLVAANFVILGQIINRLGSRYSRLSPKKYLIVFCSCDLVALVVQAVGGAKASHAVQTDGNPNVGSHIMLAGIAFQMAAITFYVLLAAEYIWRYLHDVPFSRSNKAEGMGAHGFDRKHRAMLAALAFSSVTLFIRSVYRTIELTNGWSGRIISTQLYFNVLDGGMIVLAMYTLNIFHPGWLLGHADAWKQSPEKDGLEKGRPHSSGTVVDGFYGTEEGSKA